MHVADIALHIDKWWQTVWGHANNQLECRLTTVENKHASVEKRKEKNQRCKEISASYVMTTNDSVQLNATPLQRESVWMWN